MMKMTMKTCQKILSVVLMLSFLAAFSACEPSQVSNEIAGVADISAVEYPLTIGDYRVPLSEYRSCFLKYKEIEEKTYGGDEIWQRYGTEERLKSYVLTDLIRRRTILAMAERMGVTPGAVMDDDTDGAIREIKAAMAAESSTYHLSREELMERLNRLNVKILSIGIQIGDESTYEQKYNHAFEIQKRAAAGEDFERLMGIDNEDVVEFGISGVYILQANEEEMPPSYEDVAFDLEIDEVSEVFLSAGTLYILKRIALSADEIKEMRPKIESSYYDQQYGDLFYDIRESMEINYDENYDLINTQNLK
jgi:hypothetical protein